MTERSHQLDNRIEIVTPENIAYTYRVAGPFWRLPAYAIDVLLRFLIITAVGLASLFAFGSVSLAGLGFGFALVVWFVASWFYGSLFEIFWNGQTPGKRAFGLRVVTIDGQPINALQAVGRNWLRAVDSLPVFPMAGTFVIPCYQVGLLACMMNSRYQRLGDLACGTMVVVEERSYLGGLVRFDDPAVASLAAVLPADFIVSRSLAKALAAYVERRRYMTPARRAEVARYVGEQLLERWNMPPQTSHDLLLCSLYYRTFVTPQELRRTTDNARPNRYGAPPPGEFDFLSMVTESSMPER